MKDAVATWHEYRRHTSSTIAVSTGGIRELGPHRQAGCNICGAQAYYLLTGEQVFTGDTVLKVITQHLQAAPVPPSERTELPIPATLEHLVLACLAKQPEDRPQNARQLAQSLDTIDWSQHHPLQALAPDAITPHGHIQWTRCTPIRHDRRCRRRLSTRTLTLPAFDV